MSKKDRKAKNVKIFGVTGSFGKPAPQHTIRVKPNTGRNARWYYDASGDKTGQTLVVTDSTNPMFTNHWQLNGSLFLDKGDCELISN
jgi:hypothetical protein